MSRGKGLIILIHAIVCKQIAFPKVAHCGALDIQLYIILYTERTWYANRRFVLILVQGHICRHVTVIGRCMRRLVV